MNSPFLSWILIFSLCFQPFASYGAGVSIPTIAAVLTKATGTLVAYGAADGFKLITEGKAFKISSKANLGKSAPSTGHSQVEIKEDVQPIWALIGTGIVILGILAWNINKSKQVADAVATDKQEIEVEKG